MADLEPGVVLSPSTIAAMERLSTPSRTAMTKPYRATPEQWADQETWAHNNADSSCILELRARVAALEAAQHAHIDTSRLSETVREQIREELARPSAWRPLKVATETVYGDAKAAAEQTLRAPLVVQGTFEHGGETYRFKAKPERETAMDEAQPAGSLVDRVAQSIAAADDEGLTNMTWNYHARAATLEVAAWLREKGYGSWVTLEQEANRTTSQED